MMYTAHIRRKNKLAQQHYLVQYNPDEPLSVRLNCVRTLTWQQIKLEQQDLAQNFTLVLPAVSVLLHKRDLNKQQHNKTC